MRKAEITLTGEAAAVVEAALRPETAKPLSRATVSMERVGEELRLAIEAEDTAALRAAINSYLRWAAVAAGVRESVSNE